MSESILRMILRCEGINKYKFIPHGFHAMLIKLNNKLNIIKVLTSFYEKQLNYGIF